MCNRCLQLCQLLGDLKPGPCCSHNDIPFTIAQSWKCRGAMLSGRWLATSRVPNGAYLCKTPGRCTAVGLMPVQAVNVPVTLLSLLSTVHDRMSQAVVCLRCSSRWQRMFQANHTPISKQFRKA
jgi:hypothetical protein